ncbi:MAG TPA: hypothetical protein VD993_05935 [Chitinophagaceae bacterium]|nr:hypothetical protein [Chitinophagaceae bacterium]
MKKTIIGFLLASSIILYSCSGKPSEADIKKKILLEYVCNETAKVNSVTILKTEETETIVGNKAYKYTVSGEISWPDGCTEYGTRLEPGRTDQFEKVIYLGNDGDGNWQ